MSPNKKLLWGYLVVLTISLTASAAPKHADKSAKSEDDTPNKSNSVIWIQPDDVKSRNLFFGPGGEKDAPHTLYTFEKEDMDGTSPKFTVHDENGVKWKVKMGYEPRPETVASRLVWSVGYPTNEDYFLPKMRVEGMPESLRRGQKFVGPAGVVHNVRLKRYLDGEKKVDQWSWRDNLYSNTRELAGLRVMMALINNWDLKDDNNAVYHEKHSKESGAEFVYMVSDLGASFGSTGRGWTQSLSKGNLMEYTDSSFITKVTPTYVDFRTPTFPSIIHIFAPPEYLSRMRLRWIGRRIPREDVQWIHSLLAQLSPDQIRDAFRAAGYSSNDVEAFTRVVESRISDLGKI